MTLFAELKRRNVFRVAAAYAVVAWMVVQVMSVFGPALHAPDWVVSVFALFAVIGFPIALAVAWIYEYTPEGLKRTDEVRADESIAHLTGQKLNYVIIGSLAVALVLVIGQIYWFRERAAPALAEPAAAATPAASTTEPVLPNSVAVLPFANLSPKPEDAYFAQGVHEEVLGQLGKIKELNVIARTSVLKYADQPVSLAAVARELHVQTVMEGTVRYAGDSVRITAQLIDPKTGAPLWTDTYQRKIDDIFAIQSDIAMNIANALRAEFSIAEQHAIEQPRTASHEAYALYLQALTLGKDAVDSNGPRLALLERVLAFDPSFAAAYGMRAEIYASMFVNTALQDAVRPEERNDLDHRVRDNAARALALDPTDPSARAALQSINVTTWRWSEFEHLAPTFMPVSSQAPTIWIHAWLGDAPRAVRFAEKLAELDPNSVSPVLVLGAAYAYAGDRAASNRTFAHALELNPGHPLARVWLAYNAIVADDRDTAARELAGVEKQLGESMPIVYLPEIAYAYARLGRDADARRLFARIEDAGRKADIGDGTWAVAYYAIGDEQKAVERLEAVAAKARRHEIDAGYIPVMNLRMNFLADPRLASGRVRDVLSTIRGD